MRLQKIAEMVKNPNAVDVGTDHGLLAVLLAARGVAVLATDVNPGPLRHAKENIKRHGVANLVKTQLCDGLEGIPPQTASTCVIAGMGGHLIIHILRQNLPTALSFSQILLSPQRDVPELRKFLHTNGFVINNEEILEENGKFYNILDCAAEEGEAYDEKDYIFGKILPISNSEVFIRFLRAEVIKTRKIIDKIEAKSRRKSELEKYLQHCNSLNTEV